jgi:hypothetical protein
MASFGLYLASVSAPIAQRVLTGLGIGVVTYVGLQAVFDQLQSLVINYYGSIPLVTAQLLGLAGIPQGIGLILAALATRFSMLQLAALGRVV